jgi:hypothetical protein
MQLQYPITNMAWVFTFGDSLIRLGNYEMFYTKRQNAVTAARHHGLHVAKSGEVSVRLEVR